MSHEITLSNLWQQDIQSALNANKFDLMDWQEVTKALPRLAKEDEAAALKMGGKPLRDAFWAMYKANPLIDPSLGLEVLGEIFREAMQTPGYEDLRRACDGDMVAAGLGAQMLNKLLAEIVPLATQQQMKAAANQAAELTKSLAESDELNEIFDSLAEQMDDGMKQELQAQLEAAQRVAAQCEAAYQQAQAAAQGDLAQIKATLVSQINQQAKKASGEVADQMAFVRGFSEAAGGEPGQVSLEMAGEAMRLLAYNPHLKHLADFLGWAKRTTRAAKRRSKKGHTEFTGYQAKELDPSHLASWEYAAMISQSPLVKVDFMSRVVDGGVFHRHYRGEEAKNKGGMVIVRDESGSMEGAPHALAVAVEWALLDIARKDKRDFYAIPFSYDYHVWDAQAATMESVFKHLEHFYDGGTRPWPALTAALRLIDAGDMAADILFLTDEAFGSPTAEFKQALAEAKLRRPVKIIAVVIGSRTNQVDWADKVISLSDLVKEKARLGEVFDLMV